MGKVITAELVGVDNQLDLSLVSGTPQIRLTTAGFSRPNAKDLHWYQDLYGPNFAAGGAGALDEALLAIGTFRQYKAWELIPHASNNPYIDFSFWLPPDYDASELKFTLSLVKTATATGSNIVTRMNMGCVGLADTLDLSMTTAVDDTVAVGANAALFIAEHTITPANAADGGLCHGYIQRMNTDASDDYTDSVYLLGARVEYA